MVVVQCSKVGLPYPSSLSPSHTSILFEPSSLYLALTHSDSSISLYPSFSPFSSSSSLSNPNHTQTQTLTISSPSSSSTFLLLRRHHHHHPTLLFIVSSPHPSGILLRLYRRTRRSFAPVPRVVASHPHLRFHPSLGLLLHAPHGPAVTLAASVNYLALYALSSHKLFLFAVKSHADHDGALTFVTSAVIHCSRPVFSVALHFGFLLLGHDNGVRVFGLRALVKGRSGNELRDSDPGNVEKHVKQTKIKLKHDDRDGGSCFVVLKENEVKTKSTTKVSMSIKAISIQAVSQRMFLILDSHGDLHLLSLSNSGIGVDITGNVRQLSRIMKVQSIAVLPDISTMSRTIWISDGCHSVHMFTAMDIENALNEADGNDCNKKLVHLPVIRALFSSEKIQAIISLSANSILILGQGSLYAYAIS